MLRSRGSCKPSCNCIQLRARPDTDSLQAGRGTIASSLKTLACLLIACLTLVTHANQSRADNSSPDRPLIPGGGIGASAYKPTNRIVALSKQFLTDTHVTRLISPKSCCSSAFAAQNGGLIVATTFEDKGRSFTIMMDSRTGSVLANEDYFGLANSRRLFEAFTTHQRLTPLPAFANGTAQIAHGLLTTDYPPLNCSWPFHNDFIIKTERGEHFGLLFLNVEHARVVRDAPFFCGFNGGYHSFTSRLRQKVPHVFVDADRVTFAFDNPAVIISTTTQDLYCLTKLRGKDLHNWFEATGLLPVDTSALPSPSQSLRGKADMTNTINGVEQTILRKYDQ